MKNKPKKMKSKITISANTADLICLDVLLYHSKIIGENIKNLKKLDTLEKYQKEELGDNVVLLKQMKSIIKYFGGQQDAV